MFETHYLPTKVFGLCDYCSNTTKIDQIVTERTPHIMKNGYWVDGYSKEKVKIREQVWKEVEAGMMKDCLWFHSHEDDGRVCKDCLVDFLVQMG